MITPEIRAAKRAARHAEQKANRAAKKRFLQALADHEMEKSFRAATGRDIKSIPPPPPVPLHIQRKIAKRQRKQSGESR